MTGRIYLLGDGGSLIPMEEGAYEAEDVLQTLLADHPDVLAGEQMNPDEPRRWILIRRERSVPDQAGGGGRWSLDHLFLDQEGIPTLVEVKRSSDTRIRREVVGQMLDYASNAVAYWPLEELKTDFEAQCDRTGTDPERQVLDLIGDGSATVDEYWQSVKTNLRAGRVRMVFVADHIPRELQRIVEFLNKQLDPAEVLAVEVRQFIGGGDRTLVPRVMGQTAEAVDRKTSAGPRRHWEESGFLEDLAERRPSAEVVAAKKILAWAREQGAVLKWGRGRVYGTFAVRFRRLDQDIPSFLVYSDGQVEMAFALIAKLSEFETTDRREELRRRLQVAGVAVESDALARWPRTTLALLNEGRVLAGFLEAWEWFADVVVGGSTNAST